jgi:hypothetical protein
MAANADSFVPVTGVVHLPTALGVFLDVGERRLFLRYADTSTSRRHFVRGENDTLDVRRRLAEVEGLIAIRPRRRRSARKNV